MAPNVTDIVFDMGGVLLAWEPLCYAQRFTGSEPDARMVCDALFGAPAWSLSDAGVFGRDAVLLCAHAALPERLHEACDQAYEAFPRLQEVLHETNDLGRRLKEAGYGVWLLSNVSLRFRAELEPRIPLCAVMDGIMTSAEERLMKPDPAIFRRFCEKFHVEPQSCLFVDDTQLNCVGAQRAGWDAFHFTGDCGALAEKVRQAGALPF